MKILAINPPIIDFAAYDFWLKPYGFLVLLTYLKKQGFKIDFVDCLEKKIKTDCFGRGRFFSCPFPKPALLKNIPRQYRHYGMPPREIENSLKNKDPQFILISSSMTYWYPAVKEVAQLAKKLYPQIKTAAGGNYINLCPEHAKASLAVDFYVQNEEIGSFINRLGATFRQKDFFSTLPQYEFFYPRLPYAVIRTSWGCPFRCSFCAAGILFKDFFRLESKMLIDFIAYYRRKGVMDFVFYDDAFLYPPSEAEGFLRLIAKSRLKARFHTPNALHMKFLTPETARLLKECNFVNPHFGLETLDKSRQKEWGGKVEYDDLERTIRFMRKAGFEKGEFSVYLLLGYPEQNIQHLKKEAELLWRRGVRISLAEFSPVPRTEMFRKHPPRYSDPLWHNNSLFGYWKQETWKQIFELKNYVRLLNRK